MKITEMKGASLLPKKKSTDTKKMFFTEEETMKVNSFNSAVTQLEQCSVEVDCEELVKKLKTIRIGGTLKDDNDKIIHLVLGDCYDDTELLKLAQELSKCKQNWLRLERNA